MLFLVDPIDEVAIQNLKSYKDKSFVDISKEDLDLGGCIVALWHCCLSSSVCLVIMQMRTLTRQEEEMAFPM